MLKIDGLVKRSLALDFARLAELDGQVADISTLVSGREGGAVRLAAILEFAGVLPDATQARLDSSDGKFSKTVPLAALGDALVTYRLGEEPLPERFGGPVRFFIPDAADCGMAEADACANVKFLGSITISA